MTAFCPFPWGFCSSSVDSICLGSVDSGLSSPQKSDLLSPAVLNRIAGYFLFMHLIHHSDCASVPLAKLGSVLNFDRMLDHKSIPEIIKAANKKGSKNLTPADAAEAISTKYGPTVPKELTQKEIDDLADYLVKIYPDRR
jgi:hypothetical protein